MKIGLFFGTFNPVHVGHMVIAGYMSEFTDLDKVWLVVSPQNPMKRKASLLADYHRLELVKLAIGDNNKLQASDIEFKLSRPSYTIHTLTYLKEKYPKYSFALIMGSDNLETFYKWKNFEQILGQCELYVYPRTQKDSGQLKGHPRVKLIKDTPLMEISATFIRKAIKGGKNVCYMLPESVSNYIKEMHFYEK